MRLDAVLSDVEVQTTRGDLASVDVSSVTHDSVAVGPGALFCAVRGSRSDGHEFATTAVDAGAVAVLGEHFVDVDVPQAVVASTRPAMAAAAAALYGHPSRALSVVGVTGTNGKTTTTYLLQSIFEAAGRRCGVIGSINNARTTPEAPELQATLAAFRDDGYSAVAMEVSSAALVAHRVDATEFRAAVFTNLGRDHLGEVHASMDAYFEAKAMLFTRAFTPVAVINVDDEWGRRLEAHLPREIDAAPFSFADAHDLHMDRSGSRFTWRGQAVELRIAGRFNVANALAAATTAERLDVPIATVAAGLGTLTTVPGHLEWIDAGQPFAVAVDYAHTPEALESVLRAGRELVGGRLIVVFGCGGDRDPGKRGPMGAAATALSDLAFLTSDNPRHEDPDAIIAQVAAGADARRLIIEPDRAAAIARALDEANPGDLVLIAGKGHETGQQIGDTVHPFDDREVARRRLEAVAP
jgi:UDP-N-acetylmuramoyl-L-alanyl-D-glutamate--2,6-diaminopimelate ligase